MFDWFKKKGKDVNKDDDNVVPLPFKPRVIEPSKPEPAPEKLPTIHYRVGKADDGRVTLQIGDYGNILYMNNAGVQNLIKLLESAMTEEDDE